MHYVDDVLCATVDGRARTMCVGKRSRVDRTRRARARVVGRSRRSQYVRSIRGPERATPTSTATAATITTSSSSQCALFASALDELHSQALLHIMCVCVLRSTEAHISAKVNIGAAPSTIKKKMQCTQASARW